MSFPVILLFVQQAICRKRTLKKVQQENERQESKMQKVAVAFIFKKKISGKSGGLASSDIGCGERCSSNSEAIGFREEKLKTG